MTAWHITFEVYIPDMTDARDDIEAISAALLKLDGRHMDDVTITVEPTPSRFGPVSRSQDERRS